MSGLGALWGFIKSKLGSAAFRDVGTSAGNVVALNGSAQLPAVDGSLLTGVGSGWSHDVTSSAELATALAVPGARIRATASFTVNSSLAISAGYYVLGRDDPDVQITFGSSGQLTAAAACGIDFYDPFWAKGDTPFVVAGGSFGACFQATTNLMLGGNLSIQCNTSGASLGCAFNFSGLRIRGGVYFQLSTLAGWADSFIFEGTSSANAYLYSQCAGWGRALFTGDFRPFNSGGGIASNYSALLYNPGSPTAPHYGPITFSGHAQNPAVFILGNNGSRVILDSVMSTDGTYIPRVGLSGGAECRGGTFYPRYTDTSDAALVAFRGCRLLAPTFESGSDSYLHEACEFAEAFTFPSDSKPVLAGCFNTAALVFQSGSKPRIADHTIGNGTSITLDSGAAGRLVRTRGAGTGAITNNDPLSIVTLSENVTWDTTPHTRRWQTSGGAALPDLDAFARKYQAAYFDFAEAPDPMPNKAPNAAPTPGFCTFDAAASSAGIDGKGLDIDTNDESFRFNPIGIPRSAALDAGSMPEWSFRFAYKPTASPPSATQTVANLSDGASGAGEFDLNHLITSGFLGFWNGSSNVNGTTALVAGTTYDLIIQKRLVSGTPTYEVYLDNVLEISTTTNANVAVPVNATFGLGRYATGGNGSSVGVYSSLAHFLAAIPSARRAELAAGAVLVGADL